MRYLYQQLLAFCMVILVTLIVTGIAFIQLTKHTVEESNYKQLFGYADAVGQVATNFDEFLSEDMPQELMLQNALSVSDQVLNQQDVNFMFVNSQQQILYPTKSDKDFQVKFSQDTWNALVSGQKKKITIDTNLYGEHEPTSYALVPFELQNQFYGILIVTQPAKNMKNTVDEFRRNLIKGFVISAVLALVISYFYAMFQLKRITRMKQATQEVANGNFDIRLPIYRRDEFDDLAEDFNQMTVSLKESQEQIEEQEERRRQFMADAAHEMRTPLTTISGLLEGLAYHAISEDQQDQAIYLMQGETTRLIRLVNDNLDYEKIRTNQVNIMIKKFNATETVRTILAQLEGVAQDSHDVLVLATEQPVTIFADYDRFIQIMVNILRNAIQFTENGQIQVTLEKGYLETIVRVCDNGIGMSPEQLKSVWDRYYKADPSRKNRKYGESGLGLPIVQQLVKMHKGSIEIDSDLGVGTTVTLVFPDTEILDEEKA